MNHVQISFRRIKSLFYQFSCPNSILAHFSLKFYYLQRMHRKSNIKITLQESMILCFCWSKVGPGIISEILHTKWKHEGLVLLLKRRCLERVQKLSPMGCQDVLPTKQINFVPIKSKSGKGRPCLQSQWHCLGCWPGNILVLPFGDLFAIFLKKQM